MTENACGCRERERERERERATFLTKRNAVLFDILTHTHTQGNLVDKKETSIKYALLNIYITDRLLI